MAVVKPLTSQAGVQIGDEVDAFLATRLGLRARLPELLQGARTYFPSQPIRVSIDIDPEDPRWEMLLIEIVSPDADDAQHEQLDRYVATCLRSAMREFPTEVMASISGD